MASVLGSFDKYRRHIVFLFNALFGGFIFGGSQERYDQFHCPQEPRVDWSLAKEDMWDCVEKRSLSLQFVERMAAIEGQASSCAIGIATATTLAAAHVDTTSNGASLRTLEYVNPLDLSLPLRETLASGFPIFGALEWLSARFDHGSDAKECNDHSSREFHALLAHHLASFSAIPMLQAFEYVGNVGEQQTCLLGRVAGLLAVALAFAHQVNTEESRREMFDLIDRAEELLRSRRDESEQSLVALGHAWPIWALLHRLSQALAHRSVVKRKSTGCLIMVYAYPTSEIRSDTAEALKTLEQNYFQPLQVRYPLVVFTDNATALTLQKDLGPFTSAPLVPAVIPAEELTRPMSSYSCFEGVHCTAGGVRITDAHRANVNKTQFWSPDYLRISRYTAGPLFLHSALDDCGAFIKVDTDLFFTAPLGSDPIAELKLDGSQLAYWQIHVQGQRQQGFMDAALEFLDGKKLRIRNKAFYARGKFEEKAKKLGISVSEVPEALESATVVYGCLFGGNVQFFREPLYQSFFEHMSAKNGFETRGWSNQFFLGVTGAAFLFPSQTKRLYISARHQESKIDIFNGSVTEFLLGSLKSVLR